MQGERGIEKNHERNTVVVKNQFCNQTCVKYIRTQFLGLCREWFSLEKSIYFHVLDILSFGPTHFSPVFQPTFYKFIVLGFLGLSPFFLDWAPNLVLTLSTYVCPRKIQIFYGSGFSRWWISWLQIDHNSLNNSKHTTIY